MDPEKMSGVPVFNGTRVSINHLFEYLESGETLDEFLDQFPTVSRELALGVLKLSKEYLFSKMKLLLDECLTRLFKRDFIGHEVATVAEAGFQVMKNGALLRAASLVHDVLVTCVGHAISTFVMGSGSRLASGTLIGRQTL